MKTLVIGYGSIGNRHAKILAALGQQVAVVSTRDVGHPQQYCNIASAISEVQPEYVVIANSTSKHYETMSELIRQNFRGIVLVEKPLFHELFELPNNHFHAAYVAYNLRFHPLIKRLHSLLKDQIILSVHAYVGQYLPNWRPQTDYRLCYSAHKLEGGGVLRDLSHELDYITWMLGGWKSVIASGGKYSQLEIDSEDVFSMMITTPKCQVVTIHLNYLDRVARRQVLINTDKLTIELDLISGFLKVDEVRETCEIDRDYTYRLQHEMILSDNTSDVCTLQHGLNVMHLIHAAEESAICRKWVYK